MIQQLNRKSAAVAKQYPIKVLQFGGGNFLKGFADCMIDVMNEKLGLNAGIQVIQPLRKDSKEKQDLQDGLFHVVLNGIQNGKPYQQNRLVTCVQETVNPYEDYAAFLKCAENPELKFVFSNTTEAGIVFRAEDKDINTPADSFPGKVTALLYQRFNFFKGDTTKGLTFFPCELIENNGQKLKAIVLQYCDHWKLSDDFKSWINNANIFCDTLVDRIVPGAPKQNLEQLQKEVGFADQKMITAEPFHLFVVQAPEEVQHAFPADKAGLNVKFVKDLTPYRIMKVRILNGAHTTMVPVAYLRGLRTVQESIKNDYVGNFIREAIEQEIIPTLDLNKDELTKFAQDVIERFQNPFIRHELMSIALNSISKFTVRVLPTILQYQKVKGTLPQRLVYAFACLLFFYRGRYQNETIALNDSKDVLDFFKTVWTNQDVKQVVRITLAKTEFWGTDLNAVPALTDLVERNLTTLMKEFE